MSPSNKSHTEPSIHSRAARRATSPSLQGNVSQSLKDIQPPSRTKSTTHIFSGSRDGGIRKKKSKQLKRGQLERHRKGIERADIVKGQLDVKLVKSLGRLKTIKERRKEWGQVNAEAEKEGEEGAVRSGMFAALEGLEGEAEEQEVEEDTGGETMTLELPVRTIGAVQPPQPVEASVSEEEVIA